MFCIEHFSISLFLSCHKIIKQITEGITVKALPILVVYKSSQNFVVKKISLFTLVFKILTNLLIILLDFEWNSNNLIYSLCHFFTYFVVQPSFY